jgi:ABC-2 type transport system ATP-binding protein
LRKDFDGTVALTGLDLRVERGTLYGMIGPNGSGKTTCIRILTGLLRASGGEASVLGVKVPSKSILSRIGYMPQELAVYSDLSVHENLEFFAGLFSVKGEDFLRREKEVLRLIDLPSRKDDLISTLSGGMKHRVSLACALIHDPELLFLDEPTVGVDPELRVGFWDYFNELKRQGKTIIMTTHYMDEAVRCDVVGMMRLGEMMAEGSPQELLSASSASSLEDAFLSFARRPRA